MIPNEHQELIEEIYKGHVDLCAAVAGKHLVHSEAVAIENAKHRIVVASLSLAEMLESDRQLKDGEIIEKA